MLVDSIQVFDRPAVQYLRKSKSVEGRLKEYGKEVR